LRLRPGRPPAARRRSRRARQRGELCPSHAILSRNSRRTGHFAMRPLQPCRWETFRGHRRRSNPSGVTPPGSGRDSICPVLKRCCSERISTAGFVLRDETRTLAPAGGVAGVEGDRPWLRAARQRRRQADIALVWSENSSGSACFRHHEKQAICLLFTKTPWNGPARRQGGNKGLPVLSAATGG
jgi:hypothetical protein